MKENAVGDIIYRKNYESYPWDVKRLDLHFDVSAKTTTVRAEMEFLLKDNGRETHSIVLNGSDLQLVSLLLNDQVLGENDYSIEGEKLVIHNAPSVCVLKTEVIIHPASNTALEGLYASGDFLLTQCEAQGFRKITWFPDMIIDQPGSLHERVACGRANESKA